MTMYVTIHIYVTCAHTYDSSMYVYMYYMYVFIHIDISILNLIPRKNRRGGSMTDVTRHHPGSKRDLLFHPVRGLGGRGAAARGNNIHTPSTSSSSIA